MRARCSFQGEKCSTRLLLFRSKNGCTRTHEGPFREGSARGDWQPGHSTPQKPIVDLKTRRIVSFESLARWHHPMNGLIAPTTFIPLAEELGLIHVLSAQLFRHSCRDAANWPEYISLSFNFSPTQLGDKNFAQDVLTILDDAGLPPDRLEAEITESAIVSDFEATRHAIQTLRNAGVRIVIDDFGTGYSGLSQLYELRFDKLKV